MTDAERPRLNNHQQENPKLTWGDYAVAVLVLTTLISSISILIFHT